MSYEVFLALMGFSLAASITPGPNNIMLLSSGVNFGFLRTLPHMAGIVIGFGVLLACIGLGMGQILDRFPVLFVILKFAGAAYLVYLAWQVANSAQAVSGETVGQPLSFLQAAGFQWVNPKAWVTGITAITVYTESGNFILGVVLVVVAFVIVSVPSVTIWCGFGVALREWLADARRLRTFNIAMALLLVLSLWPILR